MNYNISLPNLHRAKLDAIQQSDIHTKSRLNQISLNSLQSHPFAKSQQNTYEQLKQQQKIFRPQNNKQFNLREVKYQPPIIQNNLISSPNLNARDGMGTNRIRMQLIEQNTIQNISQYCNYCKEKSQTNLVSLNCGHSFHADCLQQLMNQQVDNQLPIIKCTCQKLIPQKICTRYLSPFNLQIYLQIQTQKLAKHNQLNLKWKKCTNHGCDFVFIERPSSSSKRIQSQCPNCLEKIFGETMTLPKLK